MARLRVSGYSLSASFTALTVSCLVTSGMRTVLHCMPCDQLIVVCLASSSPALPMSMQQVPSDGCGVAGLHRGGTYRVIVTGW